MKSIFPILSAVLVIFTAMLDPRISIALATALLIVMSIYEFTKNK
ncbi:MAG: hypothetical protein ACUVWN_05285 [bacterium]